MKFIYILACSLLFINYALGQVVPHGLMNKKVYNATSTAPYFGAFQFSYDRSPATRIANNTDRTFDLNSTFTIQFEIQKYIPAQDVQVEREVYSSEMPLIGFTSGDLKKESSILLFTVITNYELGSTTMTHDFEWYVNGQGKGGTFGSFYTFGNLDASNFRIPFTQAWHITITYSDKKWKMYVNGRLRNEIQNTRWWSGTGKLKIGSTYTIKKRFQPKFILDEFRFWDRALTANEIKSNMNKSLIGNENGLKIYYNFNDQGRGNENNTGIQNIIDRSLNNSNGFIDHADLINVDNNFVSEKNIISKQQPLILNFDANNYESYPGTNKNNNPVSVGKLYNLIDFENNLQFYTNTSYNEVTEPFYQIDGGRSLGIRDIYGKSKLNSGISGDNSITVEAWVKFNSIDNQSIFLIGENFDGKKLEIAVINKKLQLDIGGDTLSCKSDLIEKKWYHITFTFTNSVYKIFLNGILETTGNYVGPPPYSRILNENDILFPQNTTNTPIFIGKTNNPFVGKISILNVYNIAFDNKEVELRFVFNKARFGY